MLRYYYSEPLHRVRSSRSGMSQTPSAKIARAFRCLVCTRARPTLLRCASGDSVVDLRTNGVTGVSNGNVLNLGRWCCAREVGGGVCALERAKISWFVPIQFSQL